MRAWLTRSASVSNMQIKSRVCQPCRERRRCGSVCCNHTDPHHSLLYHAVLMYTTYLFSFISNRPYCKSQSKLTVSVLSFTYSVSVAQYTVASWTQEESFAFVATNMWKKALHVHEVDSCGLSYCVKLQILPMQIEHEINNSILLLTLEHAKSYAKSKHAQSTVLYCIFRYYRINGNILYHRQRMQQQHTE